MFNKKKLITSNIKESDEGAKGQKICYMKIYVNLFLFLILINNIDRNVIDDLLIEGSTSRISTK